jgi:3-hydroxyacyl-[acyl-carrier-protein] dehydratase
MSLLDSLPTPTSADCVLDHAGILAVLPHRHPFLLVDRLLAFEAGVSAVGSKCVSFGEPWVQGHFPSEPVFPGVLQVEAIAQVACILVMLSFDEAAGKRPAFAGIDSCRFRRPVRPGDVLRIETTLKSWRRNMGAVSGRILVGDKVVCDAEIMAAMV